MEPTKEVHWRVQEGTSSSVRKGPPCFEDCARGQPVTVAYKNTEIHTYMQICTYICI